MRLLHKLCCALVLGLAIPALPAEPAQQPKSLVWRTLEPFTNTREFNDYRRRTRELARQRYPWWGSNGTSRRPYPLLAQVPDPCDPAIEECPQGVVDSVISEVIVSGYRASNSASASVSVTNNQVAGVDEGDIVKVFDRFFVVLLHGRLFSVDTGAKPGELTLVDRVNAYQSASVDSWIDELLIHDDVLMVTGYSYDVDASVISLFRIGRDGVFQPLARYFIESNDYYSGENYASRIVDGRLVIYTPFELQDRSSDAALAIPRIRSWTEGRGYSAWRPLFHITDVYRPIQPTLFPALHVISVCPIVSGRGFRCESTGIVGPWQHETYVARSHAYLWLTSDDVDQGDTRCAAGADWMSMSSVPSAAYRLAIPGGALTAVHTQGEPGNQFAFAEQRGVLWSLVRRPPLACEFDPDDPKSVGLALAKIPTRRFSSRPPRLGASAWFRMPETEADSDLRSQYSEDYLLFGSPQGAWQAYSGREYGGDGYKPGKLAAVPLANPRDGRVIPMNHSIERIELFGAHALAFGYQGIDDFVVSSIALGDGPRVADAYVTHGVAESEGRSHAFNGLVQEDGSGIFGIPTVDLATYRSRGIYDMPADVSFLTADTALRLASADKLGGSDPDTGDYRCEVSCYDWYGNTRPIFYRDRIFALTGVELIEGALRGGRMAEVTRVNLTAAPRHPR